MDTEDDTTDLLAIEADLVERAHALGPKFRERAAATEANRSLLKETMRDLFDARLVRFFQPRRHGGFELEWGAQYSIGRAVANYCPSTAWIVAVVGAHASFLARMRPEVQDEVWGPNQDQLIATASVNKRGGAKRVPGGLRVDGQWGFSSGCDHADWLLFGVKVENSHDHYQIVVPRRDVEIVDTWFVAGMRGTGTKDLALKDVFVPEHRTLHVLEWINANPPGARVNPGYISHVEFAPFVGTSLLGPMVGSAEGAFHNYVEATRVRRGVMFGDVAAEAATVQLRLAESSAELAAANLIVRDQIGYLREAGRTRATVPGERRLAMNRDRAFAVRLCVQATERLVSQMGAMGVFDSNPVQRHARDVNGIATQIGINWDRNMAPYAKWLLGVPTGDTKIDAENEARKSIAS
jgi:3-hydroxy-9,10-secoandrosta-1,3,5(10)-triene-9,17-dione monooxygenase